MMKVIFARWPADLIIANVRVQGAEATGEIVAAMALLNRLDGDDRPDVLIVGRGGGSIEDLWAFNEEPVARAIRASEIPVISAIGHEVDFTIADFASDLRCATPSHAGETVVPRLDETLARLEGFNAALPNALVRRLELARERLASIENSRALHHPEQRIEMLRQRLDGIAQRLNTSLPRHHERLKERIAALSGKLDTLSPLRVLHRGYSVTRRALDGAIVHDSGELQAGERIRTQLARGEVESEVTKLQP
jgi:exodeoxyribonuclease VII large subunit